MRTLAVEQYQADYQKRAKSLIRIKGRWLRAAGFEPGKRVALRIVRPGVIEMAVEGEPMKPDLAESFTITCQRLDHALAQAERQ